MLKEKEIPLDQFSLVESAGEGLCWQWDQTLRNIAECRGIDCKKLNVLSISRALQDRTLEQSFPKADYLILTGPSSVGKTTWGNELEKQGIPRLPRTVTRPMRPGEKQGVTYHYINNEQFYRMIEKGDFLWYEINKSRGEHQAIERELFEKAVARGPFYIDASYTMMQSFFNKPEASKHPPLTAFLLPPSFGVLMDRMTARTKEELKMVSRGETGTPLNANKIIERLNRAVEMLETTADNVQVYLVNDKKQEIAEKILRLMEKLK